MRVRAAVDVEKFESRTRSVELYAFRVNELMLFPKVLVDYAHVRHGVLPVLGDVTRLTHVAGHSSTQSLISMELDLGRRDLHTRLHVQICLGNETCILLRTQAGNGSLSGYGRYGLQILNRPRVLVEF